MAVFKTRYVLRAAAAVLLGAALTACASTSAPIASRNPLPPVWSDPSSPVDPYAPPRIVEGATPLQCVPFARSASGVEIYGDANTWWQQAEGRYPRSSSPAPGSVLVLRGYNDPGRGHVAVVSAIVSARVIRVDQANWLNQGEITLSVPVMDVSPNNDWTEVRVWYIPTNDWGVRIYQAEGFIHAFALQPFA
ncbi:MAG: CHAP domain-containing protein [Terricaulis sp.]